MSTSGQIESLCRPWLAAVSQNPAAPSRPSPVPVEKVEKRVPRTPVPARHYVAPQRPAATDREEDWAVRDDECGYYDESYYSEEDDAAGWADQAKVEEYLLAMYPDHAAIVVDVAAAAVQVEPAATFAAIAWGKQQMSELLHSPAAAPAPAPVFEPEPEVEEWGLVEIATPRSVASETSWADCGSVRAPEAMSYAAALGDVEAGAPAAAPRGPPCFARARQGRARPSQEMPAIPEAEAAKEDLVLDGEQRRFAMQKEKRRSAPRAKRLERAAARLVAAC